MNKFINKIYENTPIALQNAMISAYGYYWKNRRLGKVFKENLNKFKLRESFTEIQWLEYQTLELRKLLIHAYKTVPFYSEKYKEAGFSISDFEKFQLSDLNKLPFLEKEDLRKFGKTTLLSETRSNGKFYSSSGSTGTPISVYFSKDFHQIWNAAYEVRVRNWAGVDHTMNRGMIGGRRVLPSSTGKPPYYRYNAAEKQTYFSAYHISEKTTPNYVEGFRKNKVEYLVGYAMSIYILADFILNLKIECPKMVAVLTSSEKLTSNMRATIERAFGCKVYDGYSGVEACGLISENDKNELLFSPDTGIMEVVNEIGNQVSLGESGEVVATGLLNSDQPLIRYRIGDRVKISKDQSSHNFLKIDEIEGRVEDVIGGLDGRKMVRFHSLFIDIPNLKAAQIIQNKIDLILINLVPDINFDKKNEKIIINRLKSQLGDINVEIIYLDTIPKEKNGKFIAVISNV
jgi:phenylacetate-CoA ligase